MQQWAADNIHFSFITNQEFEKWLFFKKKIRKDISKNYGLYYFSKLYTDPPHIPQWSESGHLVSPLIVGYFPLLRIRTANGHVCGGTSMPPYRVFQEFFGPFKILVLNLDYWGAWPQKSGFLDNPNSIYTTLHLCKGMLKFTKLSWCSPLVIFNISKFPRLQDLFFSISPPSFDFFSNSRFYYQNFRWFSLTIRILQPKKYFFIFIFQWF